MTRAVWADAREDPLLARATTTIGAVQATPRDLMADPVLGARVVRYVGRPYYAPGADRAELLAAVRGAERGR